MNEWAFCCVEFVSYDRLSPTTEPHARCSVYCDNLSVDVLKKSSANLLNLVAIVPYKTKKQCLYSYFIFI